MTNEITSAQPKLSFRQIRNELRHLYIETDEHELTIAAARIKLATRMEPHKNDLREKALNEYKPTTVEEIAVIAKQLFNQRTAKKKLRELCPNLSEADLSIVVGRIELATLAELHKKVL